MLTQEEIDALLAGTGLDAGPSAGAGASTHGGAGAAMPSAVPGIRISAADLDGNELKALGERLKAGFASAADVSATLLNRGLSFSPISIDMEDDPGIAAMAGSECVCFEFSFSGAAAGAAAIGLPLHDAALFADIMMGGDGAAPPAALDELHQTAVKEAMMPLVNGLCSALSREVGGTISPGPMSIRVGGGPPLKARGRRVFAQYSFELDGVRPGSMFLVMDSAVGRSIAGTKPAQYTSGSSQGGRAAQAASTAPAGRSVEVQQVQFPTLTPVLSEGQSRNIEILLDVPMQVTVELGRTTMMIRDVLELGTGSIIELDKLAGEPVDLLVNSKLIARGEVVVIDESFGVRVTDIISPMERIKNLQ
jgi:flagellar motor switch protein FliN/FliY